MLITELAGTVSADRSIPRPAGTEVGAMGWDRTVLLYPSPPALLNRPAVADALSRLWITVALPAAVMGLAPTMRLDRFPAAID
jgi:hypothetical protein